MNRWMINHVVLFLVTAAWLLQVPAPADAQSSDRRASKQQESGEQTSSVHEQLQAAIHRAASQKVQLQYKFRPGEEVAWKVLHLGTTETTIDGNTQQSKVRSASTKVWKIKDVDDQGNMTFVHRVDHVKMWQKVSGRPELRYDSDDDATPPPEYQQVAKTVGVPISEITISPSGRVVKRDKPSGQGSFGLGEIVMPFPEEPVAAGHRWTVPREISVRLPGGRVKRIKTRTVFQLRSVKAGIARIDVDTEVLTPVNDPRVESQLMQQLTKGEVRFDVDAGRISFRQIDWDDTVVGFNGNDSMMKYLARFTEELVPSQRTAQRSTGEDR